jgi:histidinol-phosphate aminotransferase
MIQGRKLSENLTRSRQGYDTRLDKVRLGMNERVPTMPSELFNEIMSGYTIEEASSYPELKSVYSALANYINQPEKRILFAAGADVAIKMTLETFCENGSTIITCSPTYAMYKVYAKMLNCKLKGIMCDEFGNSDLEQLISQSKQGANAIILANPNGVTGFYFSTDELRVLLSELPNIPIIIDEAYADFACLDSASLLNEFDNLIIIRSFSKNVGFTGLQVGYILANESVIETIEKFKPGTEINSLAAHAVKVLCTKPDLIQKLANETIQTRHKFATDLQKLGFKVIEKGGNFIMVDLGDKKSEIENNLIKNNVEFKSLSAPFNNYIRLTIADAKTMDYIAAIIQAQ